MKPMLIGENSGCQYSEKSKPNQTKQTINKVAIWFLQSDLEVFFIGQS